MKKRKLEYKPLLFTTTLRSPERMKGLLNILSNFNGKKLTNSLATKIVGELIKFGLYRPLKQTCQVKEKWRGTKKGKFSQVLLSNDEVRLVLINNPQNHKEAGFDKGWPSRFATIFDFAKELGFVYYGPDERIEFSKVGLKLASSLEVTIQEHYIQVSDVHPELEQQAFLHALAKYQRNNPFVRVLNENVPLILLLEVIKKLNADKDFNNAGISKIEIPLIVFWKNNNSEELYQRIKKIREAYNYNPSPEVIVDVCVNEIMNGNFKKFKPKSILNEYPDEFIRKMRLTGLISLRGGGRFIDINTNEQTKVNYILKNYSNYKKYSTEKEYFNYMATIDENLISFTGKVVSIKEREKDLSKWTANYPWEKIKTELLILAKKKLSQDDMLKYLSNPIRLEFLIALAIKSRFPAVTVIPNYPTDDTGLPTSTAGGVGDKGDIECYEDVNGVLVEVTMSEGRIQTTMEVWPIARHLEELRKKTKNSMCYFVAPSMFRDSIRQINFVKKEEGLLILPKTIEEFLEHLGNRENLYYIS
ncbi:MAG: AlwI family type II restriction endonuclease [Candidatus Omnitrophota bacterium]